MSAEQLSERPRLLTFAYGTQSQGTTKRTWGDIARLGRANQWLIFAWNTFIVLLAATVLALAVTSEGPKGLFALILFLYPIAFMVPGLVTLWRILHSRIYTEQYRQEQVRQIVEAAKQNMRKAGVR